MITEHVTIYDFLLGASLFGLVASLSGLRHAYESIGDAGASYTLEREKKGMAIECTLSIEIARSIYIHTCVKRNEEEKL